MTRDLVVVGCGGFGREVVGIVDAINARSAVWNLLGFLDDAPSASNLERASDIGVPVLGGVAELTRSYAPAHFVIAIADPSVKRAVAEVADAGDRAATLVDPDARVGRDVRLGRGVVIAAGAHVTTNVNVEDHVHLDRGTQVGHDSVIGRFATVHPGAVVSGGCSLGEGSRLGTHSTILPAVRIGEHAFVGAGACVVRDVAQSAVVRGVPAR